MSNVLPLDNFRADGALIDATMAMGAIANNSTGIGTSRDKTTHANAAPVKPLRIRELENLYRGSRLIQKIVCNLVDSSTAKWGELQLANEGQVNTTGYDEYEKRLKVRSLFNKAGRNARLHGDYFLIMGIDDGLMWDEPVDMGNVRSLKWIKGLTCQDLHPDIQVSYEDPEYYLFSLDSRKWPEDTFPRRIHESRVLRFCGVELSEIGLEATNGYHDSIVQAMFSAFSQYCQAVGASSSMVQDYSVFAYGLDGLSQMMNVSDEKQRAKVTESLMHRFLAIQMGMSNIKGIMHDKEHESAQFVQRSFGGVDSILNKLEDILIAESGYPRTKLFGSGNQGVFSESGKSDRYEWAQLCEDYQNAQLQPNLEKVVDIIFAAQDGPTRGNGLEGWDWKWHSTLQLTLEEQAALEKTHSESDMLRIRSKTLHPAEARQSRYGDAAYGYSIVLDDAYQPEMEALWKPAPVQPVAVAQALGQPPKTTEPEIKTDSLDLESIRADALEGLVPMEAYWERAGLDVAKMRSLTDAQRQRNDRGYWSESY